MIDDVIDDGFVDDGVVAVPVEGSDVADRDSNDIADDGMPLLPPTSLVDDGMPLLPPTSLADDGIAPTDGRFGEQTAPLRLSTSGRDHLVDPVDGGHLAATHGGPVEHTRIERSHRVATLDHDRARLIGQSVAFVSKVAA